MRAVDTDGQAGEWTYTTVGRLRLYQETRTTAKENGTRILYDGSWTDEALAGASRGNVKWSNDSSATATFEFYGTSVAMVTDLLPDHGSFYLTIDTNPVDANPGSAPIDPLNTNSATAPLRCIVW